MPVVVHLVDDDASSRTATEYLLKQEGYEVASYPSGRVFLDRLPNESVRGCIVLKVRMPGLSGPDFQERLSDRGSALPIIFFTRYPDRTIVRTIKAGALDFLLSPYHRTSFFKQSDVPWRIRCDVVTWRQFARASRIDAARAGGPRLVIRGQTNQHAADRWVHRTHDQGPSTAGDGKNASPFSDRTGDFGERAGILSATDIQPRLSLKSDYTGASSVPIRSAGGALSDRAERCRTCFRATRSDAPPPGSRLPVWVISAILTLCQPQ